MRCGDVPVIVAAELLSGRLSTRDRSALEDLLGTFPLVPSDLAHWFRTGSLRDRLGRKGLSVSTPDARVAQIALDLEAELMSADAVFRRIAKHAPLRLACR